MKTINYFLLLLLIENAVMNTMEYQYDVMKAVLPWVSRYSEAHNFMERSLLLQQPTSVSEADQLTAIFDAQESRVTLYDGLSCVCITYEYFVACIEYINLIHNDEGGDIKPAGKRCSLQ